MLKGIVRGLRRSGILPRERPGGVVILNYNPADPKTPGDINLFTSVDALTRELRAIDLHGGGYYAVASTGRVISMTAPGEDPTDPIEATTADHASEAQLAQRMIKHFLLANLDNESDHAPDAKRRHLIEREHTTERLLELVPDHALESG